MTTGVTRTCRVAVVALTAALWLVVAPAHGEPGGDYGNPAYLEYDLENMSRASVQGGLISDLTDPNYLIAAMQGGAETWPAGLGRQLASLPYGRIFGGVGQLIPGGSVGDPVHFHDVEPVPISFVNRNGAEIRGYLFWDGQPGPHPGVSITPGSIQGVQQGYWWAARTLARAGYLVLTWDAQGQGESETFGHEPGTTAPTFDGFPFQQGPNFIEATIDALRFFLSTDTEPYLPVGWSQADADTVRAQGQATIQWSNPLAAFLDHSRIGLAGHSFGATGVGEAQQCSDEGTLWTDLALCGGRSYPIRAIVAWDALWSGQPVVPAMDQRADGYLLTPQPTLQAPSPTGQLGGFTSWQRAGVDTYAIVVRGGTHLEWWNAPYLGGSATTYGNHQADYYTLAWFERYLHSEPERQAAATQALLAGPIPDQATGGVDELAWRANFLSVKYLSAFDFTGPDGVAHQATDLRAYAGLSPVGDWAEANADRPAVRP